MKNLVSHVGLIICGAIILFVAANLVFGPTAATNSPPAQYDKPLSGIIPFPPPKPPEC